MVLIYSLLINWAMLGLGIVHIRNAWLADPAYLIEALACLWVLAGIGPRSLTWGALGPSAGAMILTALWDARHVGLQGNWLLTETTAGIILGGLCLWLLFDLLREQTSDSIWSQPRFWLLSAWALQHSVEITFYPLHNLFLRNLSREWILVPWFVKFLIIFFLNLGVARTFLCPKPSSS